MSLSPEVDECGLEAGLYAGDFGLVYVRFGLDPLAILYVEVVESLAINHRHPDLLGLGSINQHLFHDYFQLATQLGGARVYLPSVHAFPPDKTGEPLRGLSPHPISGHKTTTYNSWVVLSQFAPRHRVSRVINCPPCASRADIGSGEAAG